jgi:hypothetical protein
MSFEGFLLIVAGVLFMWLVYLAYKNHTDGIEDFSDINRQIKGMKDTTEDFQRSRRR